MQTCKGALTRPGERRTERAGPKGQTFHGYGERNARQARDGRSSVTMPSLQVANLLIVRPARHQRCLMARRRRAGGAGRTSPCRGVGQRPTPSNQRISQSANQPISWARQRPSGSPACASTPLICNKSVKSAVSSSGSLCAPSWSFVSFVTSRNTSPLSSALFVARLSRAPFSVLRSPFSGASARRRLP